MKPSARNLEWIDGRWHLQGLGIHAGVQMTMRAAHTGHYDEDGTRWVDDGPGQWFPVRIESADGGRVLIAHHTVHDVEFTTRVTQDHDLRWPRERRQTQLFDLA